MEAVPGRPMNEMTDDLKLLEQEAQRKIGRNIMNFQRIEFMIKHLVSRSQVQGTMTDFEDNLAKQEQDIHSKSLGLLARDLFKTVYTEREPVDQPNESIGPWISFTFHSKVNDSALKKFKLELEKLINQRNELIHHRLHSVKIDSPDSWRELIAFLDQQREDITPLYNWLQSLGLSMREMARVLKDVKNFDIN